MIESRIAPVWLVLALSTPAVHAQGIRLAIDPKISLAWWQMNPHLNHLWATTCPNEPSWRPGEDRFSGPGNPPSGYANVIDTVIPLYPRPWVLPLCETGIRGEVVADTLQWSRTRGLIIVSSAALTVGQPLRDEYAQKAILQSSSYPDIRFYLDSLTGVRPGDTLQAHAVGTFEFRGNRKVVVAPLKAWREAGGFRVTTRFDIPPADLSDVYGISKMSLGLGVGGKIWKMLHAGVDVVLKPVPPG